MIDEGLSHGHFKKQNLLDTLNLVGDDVKFFLLTMVVDVIK